MPDVEGFFEYEIRVGTITRVEDFPEARKPSCKMWIDFGGDLGEKQSSAQLTDLYAKEDLVGTQVVCVMNFPPRQIRSFRSDVLVLGVDAPEGVVLVRPDRPVGNGLRIF